MSRDPKTSNKPTKTNSTAIDLGFHDDELTNLELDFQKKTAILTIRTFSWDECKDPELKLKEKTLCSKPDKIVKMYLELENRSDKYVFIGEWAPVIPDTILWAYVADNVLWMTLICGYLEFKIKSYRKEEQEQEQEQGHQ